MALIGKDEIQKGVLPLFAKALNDDIPNVRFVACRIICDNKKYIAANDFEG